MRKLQNTVSYFGNVNVRQGNQLVVRVEALRSLCASFLSALPKCASKLAKSLRDDAWQALYAMRQVLPVGTVGCLVTPVITHRQRRHEIMCHRAAA